MPWCSGISDKTLSWRPLRSRFPLKKIPGTEFLGYLILDFGEVSTHRTFLCTIRYGSVHKVRQHSYFWTPLLHVSTFFIPIWHQFDLNFWPLPSSRTLWMAPILLLPDYLLWIPISRFIRWHRDMTTSRLPKLFWLRIEFSFLLWINCKKAYFNYEKKVVLACPITYDQIDEIHRKSKPADFHIINGTSWRFLIHINFKRLI